MLGALLLPVRQRPVDAHQPQVDWPAQVRQSVKRRHGSVTEGQSPVCHAQFAPVQSPSDDPEPEPRVQRELPRHQPQLAIIAQALQFVAPAQVSQTQSAGQDAQDSPAEQIRSPHRADVTSGCTASIAVATSGWITASTSDAESIATSAVTSGGAGRSAAATSTVASMPAVSGGSDASTATTSGDDASAIAPESLAVSSVIGLWSHAESTFEHADSARSSVSVRR